MLVPNGLAALCWWGVGVPNIQFIFCQSNMHKADVSGSVVIFVLFLGAFVLFREK